MIKHKCNDVVVPILPEEPDFQYSIMVQPFNWGLDLSQPVYVVIYSKMPFVVVGEKIAYFIKDNEWKCYQALSAGERWTDIELVPTDANAEVESLADTSMYVWCGEAVPQYPNFNTYYTPTTPTEVIAADPPNALSAFESAYTYSVGAQSKGLVIVGESSDGGTLSFTWHQKVNGLDGGVVSRERIFYPPTNAVGTAEYYCIVGNHLNDTWTCQKTETVVITVTEAVGDGGVVIGLILEQAGVPWGRLIGAGLGTPARGAAASAYSVRRGLLPCQLSEVLITHGIAYEAEMMKGVTRWV